jgi:hypothetical protein
MEQFFSQTPWVVALITLWTLPWKGVALWKAARRQEKWWFIAILIINSLAVLEILYIFLFSKKNTNKLDISAVNKSE